MPRTRISKKPARPARATHKLVIRVAHPQIPPTPVLAAPEPARPARARVTQTKPTTPSPGILFLAPTRPRKPRIASGAPAPTVQPVTPAIPSQGREVSVHTRAGTKTVSQHIISLRDTAPTPSITYDTTIPPSANLLIHTPTPRRATHTHHGRRHHHTRIAIHALACICLIAVSAVSPFRIVDNIRTLTTQAQSLAQTGAQSSQLIEAAQTAIQAHDISSLMALLPAINEQAHQLSLTLSKATGGSEYLLVMIPGLSGPSKQVIAASTIAQELSSITDMLATFSDTDTAPLPQRAARLQSLARSLRPHLIAIGQASATLDPDTLAGAYRHPIEQAKSLCGAFVSQASSIVDGLDLVGQLFTDPIKRRYMIVFQNNHELRATGGFMGSIAYVDIVRGRITKVETPPGGIYDIAGQTMSRTLPPEALRLLSSKFELQDANWFVDFPTSAKKIITLQNQSGNPTVDGVIAITATQIQQLIALTGPLTSEAGDTLTADNFFPVLQDRTSTKQGEEKTKIGAFFTPLLARLMRPESASLTALAQWLKSGITTRDIQAYFTTPSRQALAISAGISGALPTPSRNDFLSVTHSNIGGQKTDAVIDTTYNLTTKLDTKSATHTLTITKTHNGTPGALNYGATNIDYVRIMVPAGSVLTGATGFEAPKGFLFDAPLAGTGADPDIQRIEQAPQEGVGGLRITSEYGYTVFGGWIQTRPSTSKSVSITYTVPGQGIASPSAHRYKLTVRKQAGLERATFSSTLTAPPEWTARGSTQSPQSGDFTHDLEFDTLLEYGAVVSPSSQD